MTSTAARILVVDDHATDRDTVRVLRGEHLDVKPGSIRHRIEY